MLRNATIIPRLVSLLKSNHDEVRRNACFAVCVLCTEQALAIEILKNGFVVNDFCLLINLICLSALEIVRDLNISESRKSKFTEMAFQRILDSHLSAKYSYTGRLGLNECFFRFFFLNKIFDFAFKESNNLTGDGFYDMGPVRDGGKFLTIEELGAQEVNDRRAVLIVYDSSKR
mgnify:CR=1 FL=1